VPARQVMIEARVVLATDDWSRDLGARLSFTQSGKVGSVFGDKKSLTGTGTGGGAGLPNASISGGNLMLSLLNLANGNLLGLELNALEADNRGKIISNPRVMTSNQKPAVILNGTQIPYVTTTASATGVTSTVTFKDAFLCLLVDPQILNNDSIILTVEVQKDAVGREILPGIPTIDTKRVKTQVRVGNGETLVLGGIFDGNESVNVSKVPFLGDIPGLGNLFKTTSKQNQKIELIIFLTPRIIDDRVSIN
jgi:type IV pilus assembly protein PilQ